MKYRTVALLPLALGAILALAALLAGEHMMPVLRVGNEAGKILSVVGALAAALAFERGEYLRRAWITYGGCYFMLLLNDSLGAAGATSPSMLLVRGLLVVAGNVCSVGGTWMLARAWTVAGFEDDDDKARARKRLMFGAAALLALAVTAWPLVSDVRALARGETLALVSIASDLGDTFTLALVAQVAHTAVAMRGGVLRWPWGLLTTSGVAWILYDATSGVVDTNHLGPGLFLVFSESVRMTANGWVFGAGLAQRFAIAPGERLSLLPPEEL